MSQRTQPTRQQPSVSLGRTGTLGFCTLLHF
ncbi:hypothetical protein FAES_5202 [Fibrella aestuarina BUZ 2]|uniref:Uncharacterized protein n=1 Tax=Fibrella aestuarina BUZ 2 TaxID=1166018 RepID=I0KGE8_9BACT|nr:hypothetical protein FAES_5202 [Fibrella aestuarina BUZ 2]